MKSLHVRIRSRQLSRQAICELGNRHRVPLASIDVRIHHRNQKLGDVGKEIPLCILQFDIVQGDRGQRRCGTIAPRKNATKIARSIFFGKIDVYIMGLTVPFASVAIPRLRFGKA